MQRVHHIITIIQNLSSLFLKQLIVSAEITNSGKEFHVLTILAVNEYFLRS